MGIPQPPRQFDPGYPRHSDVEDSQIGDLVLGESERGFTGGRFGNRIAGLAETVAQGTENQAIVIDQQDVMRHTVSS